VLGRVLAILGLIAASLASSPKRPYTRHEKAFYADDATVEYVLPGLTITINSAAIAANGTITVIYTLTDPNGLPLDAAGATTPGTISLVMWRRSFPRVRKTIQRIRPVRRRAR